MQSYSELALMVASLAYKENWRFALRHGFTSNTGFPLHDEPPQAANAATASTIFISDEPVFLIIELRTPDSGNPQMLTMVQHTFAVPPADVPHMLWDEWLIRCILCVETHEMCEFFSVNGAKPFYPEHGPSANLYAIKRKAA